MDDSFILLDKMIQRRYKLATKDKIYDFHFKFRKAFESLSKIISSLANFITIKEFEELLISPKKVPLSFLNYQEELTKFSEIVGDLKLIGFDGYEIVKIVDFLIGFLKNDKNNMKQKALLQLLERLFII